MQGFVDRDGRLRDLNDGRFIFSWGFDERETEINWNIFHRNVLYAISFLATFYSAFFILQQFYDCIHLGERGTRTQTFLIRRQMLTKIVELRFSSVLQEKLQSFRNYRWFKKFLDALNKLLAWGFAIKVLR